MLYNAIEIFINWQYTPYILASFIIASCFKMIGYWFK